MCREHSLNFKQPVDTVMNFGTFDANMQFHMKREFYAKNALTVEVDKYKLNDCAKALERLETLRDG